MIFLFDWYQASVAASHEAVMGQLIPYVHACDRPVVVHEAGKYGYQDAMRFVDPTGQAAGSIMVMWGGNPGIFVCGTGPEADGIAQLLRSPEFIKEAGPHKVSRVDSATDISQEGLFDTLYPQIVAFAEERGVLCRTYKTHGPNGGTTVYVGAPGEHQIRVYEKGKQQLAEGFCSLEDFDPSWVRFEFQARPMSKAKGVQKRHAAKISEKDVWGFAAFGREFLDKFLNFQAPAIAQPSSPERSPVEKLSEMVHTYKRNMMAAGIMGYVARTGRMPESNWAIKRQTMRMISEVLDTLYDDTGLYNGGIDLAAACQQIIDGADLKKACNVCGNTAA